jgi:hypothetical protein
MPEIKNATPAIEAKRRPTPSVQVPCFCPGRCFIESNVGVTRWQTPQPTTHSNGKPRTLLHGNLVWVSSLLVSYDTKRSNKKSNHKTTAKPTRSVYHDQYFFKIRRKHKTTPNVTSELLGVHCQQPSMKKLTRFLVFSPLPPLQEPLSQAKLRFPKQLSDIPQTPNLHQQSRSAIIMSYSRTIQSSNLRQHLLQRNLRLKPSQRIT